MEQELREISCSVGRLCGAAETVCGDSGAGIALQFRSFALRPGAHRGLRCDSEPDQHFGRGDAAFPGAAAAKPGTAQLVEATAKRKRTEAGGRAESGEDVQ